MFLNQELVDLNSDWRGGAMSEKQVVELKQAAKPKVEKGLERDPWRGAMSGMWRGHERGGEGRRPGSRWEHLGIIPLEVEDGFGGLDAYLWEVYRGKVPERYRYDQFWLMSKTPRITLHRGGSSYRFGRDRDTGFFKQYPGYGPLWNDLPELWHCFEHLLADRLADEAMAGVER